MRTLNIDCYWVGAVPNLNLNPNPKPQTLIQCCSAQAIDRLLLSGVPDDIPGGISPLLPLLVGFRGFRGSGFGFRG